MTGFWWKASIMAFLSSTAIMIAMMVFMLFNPFVDKTLYRDILSVDQANAVSVAVQLGRLDLVSFALTFLGLMLGGSALFAYYSYGTIVERAATEETRKIAPEIISDLLKSDPQLWVRLIRENPDMFRSALKDTALANGDGESNISGSEANEIAAASGTDGDG